MDKKFIREVIKRFKGKKILIIGDLMIDHYIWGGVERISPEAPVPVVDVKGEEYRLGGAANVVSNIKSLGADPYFIGLVGNDENGKILKNLFIEKGINPDNIIADSSRRTTIKTRILAHKQQIVRIDTEDRHFVDYETENLVIERLESLISNTDAVILEDYNKGILSKRIIKHVIARCNELKIPVTVDPKFNNFFEYENVTVFKPNLHELEKNTGLKITDNKQFIEVSCDLMSKIRAEYLLITQGEKGLTVFSDENEPYTIPAFALEVFDVSGAGDSVIGTLTLCLVSGCDIKESALIANHAAGAVCGVAGISPVTPEMIIDSFENSKKNKGCDSD
ncbi:MAG: D-glycero-beta-D-manno-heptose-7-phosphate kinase [Candidatus Cloacimonadota bacterium]|nr:MAG: D-glycero-beta-D-manno-heptose-7-phosphate kinase [Candidatus Cloacimonadota bacterium]